MTYSWREHCRSRGYCLIEEKRFLLEERSARRLRLAEHFHDVRSGWRAARQAARRLRALILKGTGAAALYRRLSGHKRRTLAD